MDKIVHIIPMASFEDNLDEVYSGVEQVKEALAEFIDEYDEDPDKEEKIEALTEALDALEDAYDILEDLRMED